MGVRFGTRRGSLLFFDEAPLVGMLLAGAFLEWGRSAFWIFNEVSNIYFLAVHIRVWYTVCGQFVPTLHLRKGGHVYYLFP